ncbi:hypothetical protein KCU88_g5940, partial [Aureobasidium melanogenum]
MPEKDSKGSTDASIPPPLDPFPTYQTPYPRSNKDDDNPFIQFRRFADEQLSSLFQGIPQLFGLSSSRDPWKKEFEELMRRSHELEEGWRKQWEQEMEEMRQEIEKSKTDAWKAMEAAWKSPKEDTLWMTRGDAAKSPAVTDKLSNDPKKPALYDEGGLPKTELDAYDQLQSSDAAVEIPVIKSRSRHSSDKSTNSWFSSLGWDGKQRVQEHGTENSLAGSAETSSVSKRHSRPTLYTLFSARRMDPFSNTDHTIPWLLLSPYSPIYLSNPSQSRLFRVRIEDSEDVPLQILQPRFFEKWYTDIDEKLASRLPWADAFEDLLSLQQTGRMVERSSPTWQTPSDWIHGLVHRGSLGPAWGFNNDGFLVKRFSDAQSADQKGHCGWRRGCGRLWGKQSEDKATANNSTSSQTDEKQDDAFEDLVDKAAERLGPFPIFGSILSAADSIVAAVDQAAKDLEAIANGGQPASEAEDESPKAEESANTSTSSTLSSATSDSSETLFSSSTRGENSSTPSVVSTLTTTVTRTLPDGSIETKRVLKKRFADGTEESNESVEVRNLPSTQPPRKVEPPRANKETQTLPPSEIPPTSQREIPGFGFAEDGVSQQQNDASAEQGAADKDNKQDGRNSKRGGWFWT